jgi:hypothetical protein
MKEEGILPAQQFRDKLNSLGFHNKGLEIRKPGRPTEFIAPFFAYAVTSENSRLDDAYQASNEAPNSSWNSGWNNSHHNANWLGHGLLFAWGDTPDEAMASLALAMTNLVQAEDPIYHRFKLRQMVRPGD